MYSAYFGLKENPFSIAPDPRYLFLSVRHREALAHLLYGVGEGGGFVQLTGEIGMGKTTLCRGLLEQLPDNVDVALILNPRLTALELVAAICDDLQVTYPGGTNSPKALIDALNEYLLAAHACGRRTVLIIDEAQNLSADVLEQVRLLTNLETTKQKLLQIVLIGQPELRTLLARPDLAQLAQRVTARYHLGSLSREETAEYVQHRLAVAGLKRPIFTPLALLRVHGLSKGTPRLINVICDRAMLGAYARDRRRIGARMVQRAAREVMRGNVRPWYQNPAAWGVGASLAAVLVGSAWTLAHWQIVREVLPDRTSTLMTTQPSAGSYRPRPGFAGPIGQPDETTAPLTHRHLGTSAQTALEHSPTPGGAPPGMEAILANPAAGDMDGAFAELFSKWGKDYGSLAGVTACDRAFSVGLRCLHSSGTWNNLRNLNRPAVIELAAAGGARRYAVVEQLDAHTAMVSMGGEHQSLPITAIDRYWFGEYLLLWKPPADVKSTIYPGTRGAQVIWLRGRLDELLGPQAVAGDPTFFDPGLKARVMLFQRTRQIKEDGIVGDQTLVHLMSRVQGADMPVLAARE